MSAGEVWLMDALDRLIALEPVYAYQYAGRRFDCGQPLGLLKASLFLALQDPAHGQQIMGFLHSVTAD